MWFFPKEDDDYNFPSFRNRDMINKALLFIYEHNSVRLEELGEHVFNNFTGASLPPLLHRVMLQIEEDGLVTRSTITDGDILHPPIVTFTITGKGIKYCHKPWRWFMKTPYTFNIVIQTIEHVFTKYLPIAISITALIVAYLSYKYTSSQPKVITNPPTQIIDRGTTHWFRV